MIATLRTMRALTLNNFRRYCVANSNRVITSITEMETKVQSEQKIQTIISGKIEEYQKLMRTQSPEKAEVNKQMKIIESRLKKTYGFDMDEDPSVFPVFKFDEPEVDNQIDYNKKPK